MNKINIFIRESYVTAAGNTVADSQISLDLDISEDHIVLVIQQYKNAIMTLADWCKKNEVRTLERVHASQAGSAVLARGLAIEEELLKQIREVNNGAKSARVKK